MSKPVYYIKELILVRQKGAEMQNLRNRIHIVMRYYSQIRQNVARTQKCHWCSYHNLTFSVINYWTDTQQHGIYFYIPVIKKQKCYCRQLYPVCPPIDLYSLVSLFSYHRRQDILSQLFFSSSYLLSLVARIVCWQQL